MNIFEYVGLASKYLAKEGLSWSYKCFVESRENDEASSWLLGEGEMTIFYSGYRYKHHEHGRLSFVYLGDHPKDNEVSLVASLQGEGKHVFLNPIENPTEKQIEDTVKLIASFLRKARIPYPE